jgi:hypothetical protein
MRCQTFQLAQHNSLLLEGHMSLLHLVNLLSHELHLADLRCDCLNESATSKEKSALPL